MNILQAIYNQAQRFRRAERGAADIVGTIMLVGITVSVTVGLSSVVLGIDGPEEPFRADLQFIALPGADGNWGTGNEIVRLYHNGGDALPKDGTTIRLTIGTENYEFTADALGGGFQDGSLSIGESWQTNLPLEATSKVGAAVIGLNQLILSTGDVSFKGALVGSVDPCVADPTPIKWSVDPTPLSDVWQDDVTIYAELCPGFGAPGEQLESLSYGFGSDPDTATLGSQVAFSPHGAGWIATITGENWAAHGGEKLVFEATEIQGVSPVETRSSRTILVYQYNADGTDPTVDAPGDTITETDDETTLTPATTQPTYTSTSGITLDGENVDLGPWSDGSAVTLKKDDPADGVVIQDGSELQDGSKVSAAFRGYKEENGDVTIQLQFCIPSSTATDCPATTTAENSQSGNCDVENQWADIGEVIDLSKIDGGHAGKDGDTYANTILRELPPGCQPNNYAGELSEIVLRAVIVTPGTNKEAFVEDLYLVAHEPAEWKATLTFQGLPPAALHVLEFRYKTTSGTFDLAVYDGQIQDWKIFTTLDATIETDVTYQLQDKHIINDTAKFRITEQAGTSGGELKLYNAEIISS